MHLLSPFGEKAPIEIVFATDGYTHDTLPHDTLMSFAPHTGAAYKFYYLDSIRSTFEDMGKII